MEFASGLYALLINESPHSSTLNTVLIVFFTALAIVMVYSTQRDINAQVDQFRLAALPFSLRVAFARTRLNNAKYRLNLLYSRMCPDEWAKYQKIVQTRREIMEYVEAEAEGPLKALDQAEKYQVWWWMGVVDVPVLKLYLSEDVLERDSDDDGYWFSDDEE